jgi:hypothetical protein
MKDVQIELTSAATKGTGCLHPFHLPNPAFDRIEVFGQRSHGADMETFTAGDACIGIDGLDVRLKTPINYIQDMRARNLDTGLNAPQAHHASIHPLLDEGSPVWNI